VEIRLRDGICRSPRWILRTVANVRVGVFLAALGVCAVAVAAGEPEAGRDAMAVDPRALDPQRDAASTWRGAQQCGINALLGYLRLHGRHVERDELVRAVEVSEQGVSLNALKLAADKFGVESEMVQCRARDFARLATPCIVHLADTQSGDFILLLGHEAGREAEPVIADLARCEIRRENLGMLARQASGYVLVPRKSNRRIGVAIGALAIVGVFGLFVSRRRPPTGRPADA
jgi:Peptidase C39 family